MKRPVRIIGFKIVLFLTITVAALSQAVHQLWNWLMPGIFGLTVITFWQSVGLLMLSWLLFGGWRGFRGAGFHGRMDWRLRMHDRWAQMSPEQRSKFRESLHCGGGGFNQRAEPEAQ